MRVRRYAHDWVVRPWLLWVAVIACLVLASHTYAAITPQPNLQQIADDWRGLGYPVSCESDYTQWSTDHPAPEGKYIFGVTYPDTHQVVLSPTVCAQLQSSNVTGTAAVVFLHELYHSVGIIDEAQTQCMALGNLYQFVRTYYGVDQYKAMDMVNEAWTFNDTAPPQYHATWCRRPSWVTSPRIIRTSSTVLVKKCFIRTKAHKLKSVRCPK